MLKLFFNLSDKELIIKFSQEGEIGALEALMYRHKDNLLRSIKSWGESHANAEDIAQETFYKVIKSIKSDTYTEHDRFFAWLLMIARNYMIDTKRREKRGREIVAENIAPNAQVEYLKGTLNPEQMYHKKIDAEMIHLCLEHIPKMQRDVIVLRMFYQKGFKDIAEILGISLNTALGRMRYGLANLKKVWIKMGNEDSIKKL